MQYEEKLRSLWIETDLVCYTVELFTALTLPCVARAELAALWPYGRYGLVIKNHLAHRDLREASHVEHNG